MSRTGCLISLKLVSITTLIICFGPGQVRGESSHIVGDSLLNCTEAEPSHNESDISTYCRTYKTGGSCSHVIGNRLVFGTVNTVKHREDMVRRFTQAQGILLNYGVSLRQSCLDVAWEVYCSWAFPNCDTTTSAIQGQPLCKETCEYLMRMCDKEMEIAKGLNNQHEVDGYPYYWRVFNCTEFQTSDGGTAPECYYHPKLNSETDKLQSKDCYYGNGIGYGGRTNVTRSGITCQAWASQCPHRHIHTPNNVSDLMNASNWCRNPGGQAPDGPWCYTSDANTRWQYCDVKKCPNPPPSQAPTNVKGVGLNSTAILVTWVAVPLDFIHGHLVGHRVYYKRANFAEKSMFLGPNDTEVVIHSLPFSTNFSIQVLAVNKYGDGPRSKPVYAMTLPKNIAEVNFELTLVEERFNPNLTDHTSKSFLDLQARIESSLTTLFAGSDNFKIYLIKVDRFSSRNGSVRADIKILAQFSGNQTRMAVAEELKRSLVQNVFSGHIGELPVSSLLLKANPPPPTGLQPEEVDINQVILTWSPPNSKEYYDITNFTVQFRRSTSQSFQDAEVIGPKITERAVRDLEPSTDYVFRILANNDYGSGASEELKITTKEGLLKIILVAVLLPVVLVILVAGVIYLAIRHKRMEKDIERREFAMEKLKIYLEGNDEDISGVEYDIFSLLNIRTDREWWEIPRENIKLESEIGSGAFGVVKKGILHSDSGYSGTDCAVKMLKAQAMEKDIRDLCNELNLMALVGEHPNVVGLIGACSVKGPLWLVVRYAANGSLIRYLERQRQPEYENSEEETKTKIMTERDKLKFAFDIANGMAYLSHKKCVHRDLAARNVLLDADYTAMVSDFGLSRDVYESGAYENTSGGLLPVRWMAPESIEEYTYTTKSDVWSFGVVLWEMEALGRMPYAGMSGAEIIERIRLGYRLQRPEGCSVVMYNLMSDCWYQDPTQRPSFPELVQRIEKLLFHEAGYLEVISMKNKVNLLENGYTPEELGRCEILKPGLNVT